MSEGKKRAIDRYAESTGRKFWKTGIEMIWACCDGEARSENVIVIYKREGEVPKEYFCVNLEMALIVRNMLNEIYGIAMDQIYFSEGPERAGGDVKATMEEIPGLEKQSESD